MLIKVLGFNKVSFTDTNSGELISGTKVYFENVNDDFSPTAENGNTVGEMFLKSCPFITVGNLYQGILKPKKINGITAFVIGGIGAQV